MSALFVAARAVHYASAMLLFGELVFVIAVARPAWRRARDPETGDGNAICHRLVGTSRWSVIASIVSGGIWFAAEAGVMSGTPVVQAMNRDTLGLVVANTLFGHVWALRLGLVIALVAMMWALGRSADDLRTSRLALGAAVLAAAYLGSLASAGHAIAGESPGDYKQIVADIAHLLAAGAWLGALPALVHCLGSTHTLDGAALVTRRVSNLGLASVGVLIVSGLTNAWHLVGDVPALFGTDYGRLLLAKLGLFVVMLGLAVANRGYLAPRLSGGDRRAASLLRRNAILEITAGIGVVIIVGALGVTVPAAHQAPVWPFDHTLSWQRIQESAWVQLVLAAAGTVACIAAAIVVKGALSRPPRLRFAALAGVAVPAGLFAWLLAVPAYPTTYSTSPVRYTAEAIASGSSLYASHCSACHGRDGQGDGAAASSLPIRPTSLTERVANRREGDLFWWIARGIPGTPMPGFASQLGDLDIWDVIQFLDAQVDAQNAIAMTDRVKSLRPVVAPDFTFEFIVSPQETLGQQRGSRVTLLVFYTLPESLSRLRQLAMKERALRVAGARVIAVPMSESTSAVDAEIAGDGESIFAIASPNVAKAYAMFAGRDIRANGGASKHFEFLVDRQGYLRVRWIGIPDAVSDRTADTLGQVDLLVHEPLRAPLQWGHRH
jgi:putative copper export protein/mono/diheme cytochrome c family protein